MATSAIRTIDDTLIEQVVERIVQACRPETVILFGSAARGETTPGSDLDILVVLDLPDGITARQMSRKIHALFEGCFLPLDIVVLSKQEWEHGMRLLGSIARTAAREGVRLYG